MSLTEMIKTRREASKDKDEIDFLAKLSTEADNQDKQRAELVKKQDDLLKDYRERALHTTFPKKDKEPREETQASKKTLDDIFNAHFGALK